MTRNLACRLAVAAVAFASPAFGADLPFAGANCEIASPPAQAGESLAQGAVLKVWPRKAALTRTYKGCQTTWIESRGQWIPLGVAFLEAGEVAGFWAPPPDAITCRYQARKAVGKDAAKCPPASGLLVASMPTGCAKRILGRAGTEGCKPD
jgi:hypothetical protein